MPVLPPDEPASGPLVGPFAVLLQVTGSLSRAVVAQPRAVDEGLLTQRRGTVGFFGDYFNCHSRHLWHLGRPSGMEKSSRRGVEEPVSWSNRLRRYTGHE